MAGAFYPNYFEQSLTDEQASVKEMSMLDPSRTVMLSGLPTGKTDWTVATTRLLV